MPRKPKKPQPQPEQKSYDDIVEDGEATEEDVAVDADGQAINVKMRDWRDVEKYKEERRLRKAIDDELSLEDPPRRR